MSDLWARNSNTETVPSATCVVCCGGFGFIPTGFTTAQVEQWAEQERALAGDPTIRKERRVEIIIHLLGKIHMAQIREEGDV